MSSFFSFHLDLRVAACGTVPSVESKFQFPWQVLITHNTGTNTGKVCRGTVINDRVIMTTASCTMKLTLAEIMDDPSKPLLFPHSAIAQPDELKIWMTYGGLNEKNGMEISDIYTNPLFLSQMVLANKVDYDLALLTLKTPLDLVNENTYTPVCLPNHGKVGDKDLEGLETVLTRWYLSDSNDFTTLAEDHPHFQSNIFPRMRCRMNSENHWISDRFLCTMTPNLTAKFFTESGGDILLKNGNQYSQVGIHSWRTHFPLLYNKHPLSLASNVIGFMGKIEKYSASMNAKWCKEDWNGLPKKSANYEDSMINSLLKRKFVDPWSGTTSEFRNVRKSCKCGVVNSLGSKGRIQGGVDTAPYEYGWQVLLIFKFGSKKDSPQHLCGGALINNRIVLTAAHCVYHSVDVKSIGTLVLPENVRVYLHRYKGPAERDDQSRLAIVEAVIPHPRFTGVTLVENDIALIVLRRPICFKCLKGKVVPLCFPETGEVLHLDGRKDAKIIGWGRTGVLEPGSQSEKLQETSAKIISRRKCIEILQHIPEPFFANQVEDDHKKLCAGKFTPAWNYSDPAKGDSGGPLFLPVTRGSNVMIHVGVASMVTMSEKAVERQDVKTITFYTKTQSYQDFVDYYSLVVDALWCSR